MKLQEYMKKTNIGYRELAKKAGVHHTTIFSFINLREDGTYRTNSFRPEIAMKISKATGDKVSIMSLVLGER